MIDLKKARLEELVAKADRTPEEEAVRVALVALNEKEVAKAPQVEIDVAIKAVEDAEVKAKA